MKLRSFLIVAFCFFVETQTSARYSHNVNLMIPNPNLNLIQSSAFLFGGAVALIMSGLIEVATLYKHLKKLDDKTRDNTDLERHFKFLRWRSLGAAGLFGVGLWQAIRYLKRK